MSGFITNGELRIEAEPLSETIDAHDLGIAGGYIIEQMMGERIERLKAENAKLLRLLRALALCADDNADCDKCVMNGAVCSSVRQMFCDGMADELRAVGIEVD